MNRTWARVVEQVSDLASWSERLEGEVMVVCEGAGEVEMALNQVGDAERVRVAVSLKAFSKKIQRELLRGGAEVLKRRNRFLVRREADQGRVYVRADRYRLQKKPDLKWLK